MGAWEWATGNETALGPGNGLLGMKLRGGLGMRLNRAWE